MRRPLALVLTAAAAALPAKAEAHGRGCNTSSCDARVTHKANERKRRVIAPYRGWLAKVRFCESTNRWHLNTGNGFYGAYQFTIDSWHAVGGRGMPHLAGRLEQSYRAVLLLGAQGAGAWPVCG